MTELEYPIQSGVFVVVSVFIDPRKPKNPRIVHAAGPFDSRKAATNAAGRMKRRQAADDRRGTAHERGYNATWRKARATFLRRNPLCTECGKPALDRLLVPVERELDVALEFG